jgi:cell division protein FtsI/penicillin-binding protein 2
MDNVSTLKTPKVLQQQAVEQQKAQAIEALLLICEQIKQGNVVAMVSGVRFDDNSASCFKFGDDPFVISGLCATTQQMIYDFYFMGQEE